MQTSQYLDLAWGGYYASTDAQDGHFSVFRPLDFNRETCHASLFEEKFTILPTLDELTALSPSIWHVPFDSRRLIRDRRLQFIGCTALSRDALKGYECYLEMHEVDPGETEELVERILRFTIEPPLHLRLEIVNDELVVSERG